LSACEFDDCIDAPAREYTRVFVDDSQAWMEVFGMAFDKMTANVGQDVQLRRARKEY